MNYPYEKEKLLCGYAMCTWGILFLMRSKTNEKQRRTQHSHLTPLPACCDHR